MTGRKKSKTYSATFDLETIGTMKERTVRAMYTTWNYIAADIDWNIDEDGALEMIIDADRLLTYGNDEEAAKWFYALDDKERNKVTKGLRFL